jgi:hypothetical protein
MRSGRWSAAVLAATLAACSVSRDYAESRRVLVDVGMSGEEVRRAVGGPTRIVEVPSVPGVAEQTVLVWQYDIDRIPDASVILDLALAAGALVLVGALAAGGGGSGLGGVKVGGGGGTRYRFWVGFGADGRVRGVTNLERVR